jgi:hypothetical protein
MRGLITQQKPRVKHFLQSLAFYVLGGFLWKTVYVDLQN